MFEIVLQMAGGANILHQETTARRERPVDAGEHSAGRRLVMDGIERYAQEDRQHFDEAVKKAEQLARDPLQQLLVFVGLFIDMTDQLEEPFPGCLYASYCYQSGAISKETMARMEEMMHFWRRRLGEKIEEVRAMYPPRIPVETYQVADHVLTTFEGAFVLSKLMGEPKLASQQLIQCRNCLELLFTPDSG